MVLVVELYYQHEHMVPVAVSKEVAVRGSTRIHKRVTRLPK